MTARRVLALAIGMLVLGAAVLVLSPSPIDPLPYAPPKKVRLAENHELLQARRLAEGRVRGPEDLALDARGRIYAGTSDGKIVRIGLLDESVDEVATTGGRPLGLGFDAQGRLLVCDADKGLLAMDPEGRITTLATEAGGLPLRFTNALDIGADGTVYFTDSSRRGRTEYLYDMLEARPQGRLLRFDPASGSVTVLAEGIHFANGVALAADESFVLVAETYRYRILRHWLKGSGAGKTEVFAANLPGFPDNLSRAPNGTFWVALFTVRNDLVDAIQPYPFAKRLLAKLPHVVWPKPRRYGIVANLGQTGRTLATLQDPAGERVFHITAVREHEGILYLGTLESPWLARFPLRKPFVPLRAVEGP